MDPKKYVSYFLIVLGLLVTLFVYFFFQDKKSEIFPKKLSAVPATAKKKEIIAKTSPSRPNNLTQEVPNQKNEYYKDRRLIGAHISPEELQKIIFINEINPIWEVELKTSLSRFKVTEDDVTITHLESLLQMENGERGRYIELVKVEFANGKEFMASVDSASGKIIDSWDHPHMD